MYAKFSQKLGMNRSKSYSSAKSVPNTSKVDWDSSNNDMNDYYDGVITHDNTWVWFYSAENYGGDKYIVGPNSDVDLAKYFDHKVASFQVCNRFFDENALTSHFRAFYTGSKPGKSDGLNYSYFYAQDSEYLMYDPLCERVTYNDATLGWIDVVKFTLYAEHIQYGKNDRATVTFQMNFDGNFTGSVQVQYKMAETAQIPDWLVKLLGIEIDAASKEVKMLADVIADVIADVAVDVAVDVASGGVAVPLDPFIDVAVDEAIDKVIDKSIDVSAKALTFCVDHVNFALKAISSRQEDGGIMYFTPLVSQGLIRLISAYYQTTIGTFSTKYLNDKEYTGYFGKSWSRDNHYGNPYFEFNKSGQKTYSYRCFYPDSTFLYANYGTVCSAKIAAITNNAKDDYLILSTSFNSQGKLISVAGSVDIYALSYPSGYQAPISGNLVLDKNGVISIHKNGADPVPTTYTDLYVAFLSEMTNALNRVTGITVTDQQRVMMNAGVDVLHGMNVAIS